LPLVEKINKQSLLIDNLVKLSIIKV